MSRKDYVAVAGAIRGELEWHLSHESPAMADAVRSTAGAVASAFARENPRFDRSRFLRAAVGEDPSCTP